MVAELFKPLRSSYFTPRGPTGRVLGSGHSLYPAVADEVDDWLMQRWLDQSVHRGVLTPLRWRLEAVFEHDDL